MDVVGQHFIKVMRYYTVPIDKGRCQYWSKTVAEYSHKTIK